MKNRLLIFITTVLLLLQCFALNAVTIIVDGTDGAIDNTDGVCSISEAIINANDDAATYPDCIAGNLVDTIQLNVDVTLTTVITSGIMNDRTGTPIITSSIILDGQGHVLQRDNTLTCNLDGTADTGEFRLLHITSRPDVIIQNITLAHGCADSGQSGAGIYNDDSDLIIKKTTFDQNKSNGFGGGLYHNIGTILEISNSTFSGNLARLGGGAIYNSQGKIDTINNSTFSKNSTSAAYGGAIYNFEKKITIIRNCTFSENSSNSTFSAIYNDNNSGVISVISNNLFTQNVGSDCIIDSSTIYTNNITTNTGNFICNNITPNLIASTVGPLADNGGPTKTHALLQGSQALNKGDAGATTTDQRGFAADGVRDIGAYEAQIPVVTAPANLMFEATGATTAVTLGTATVTDADETGVTAIADLSSPFAVGIHTVTWTATDSQGHEGTDTQTVTIVDTTAPTVTPPVDTSYEATGTNTSVTLGAATASDLVDGNVSPVTANNTGPFTLGAHTITWSATDAAGNTGTATQTITIIDTTGPTVTPPSDIIIEATGVMTVVTLGSATATDLVDGVVTPVTANMSSPFAVGIHNITWSATDNAGNTGTATQVVNVQAVISGTITGLNGSVTLQNNGSDNLSLNANGGFRFTTPLDNLSTYAATVLTQPATQGCVISNASGQVNGSSISDILVNCTDNTLALDASSLDYGLVFTGDSSTQSVTLTNTGNADITISSISNPTAPFAIIGGSCFALPMTLMATQSCDIIIEFSPNSEGNYTGSFDMTSNIPASPTVINLTGSSAVRIIPTLSFYGLLLMMLSLLGFVYYQNNNRQS